MTVLDWVLLTVWFGVTLAGFWKGAMRFVLGGGGDCSRRVACRGGRG